MKIYTKTGDAGTTSLIGGQRASKNDPRLNAYGTIDELNSFLGLLRAKTDDEQTKSLILEIQNTLFTVGAYLAINRHTTAVPDYATLTEDKITLLEEKIDFIQANLPPIKNFVIYGENETSAICHVCRAVARRAEREIVAVNEVDAVDANIYRYVNRLSDFLFVLARLYAQNEGAHESFWQK